MFNISSKHMQTVRNMQKPTDSILPVVLEDLILQFLPLKFDICREINIYHFFQEKVGGGRPNPDLLRPRFVRRYIKSLTVRICCLLVQNTKNTPCIRTQE